MSNRPTPTLEDYELLALRSDGFYEARRNSDQEALLFRKITPEEGLTDAARLCFHQDLARAATFRGEGALEVVTAFEGEEAFFVGLPYFDGRTLAVQIARGRQFTFEEAWDIALEIARTMRRQTQPHGAIIPANILVNDHGEVWLAPNIQPGQEPRPEPEVAADIRQLALLIGCLAFGEPLLPEPGRAAGKWTMRSQVPGPCRSLLGHMLSSGLSTHCQTWDACVAQMEQAMEDQPAGKSRPLIDTLLLWGAVAALLAILWLWLRAPPPARHPAAASAPLPAASATPGVVTQSTPDLVTKAPAAVASATPVPAAVAATDTHSETQSPPAETAETAATPTPTPTAQPQPAAPAAATAAPSAYPGLPVLALSSSIAIGDPDFARLAAATRWAIETGGWQQHRDALDKALTAAALLGGWNQYPVNLEQILAQNTPSIMLSQESVLHQIDPSVFGALANDQTTKDFLRWLFTNPRAIAMLAQTLKPEDKPLRVLEIWRDCWNCDRDEADKTMALALAVAVDFDDPVAINPAVFGKLSQFTDSANSNGSIPATTVDPLTRFKFYRDSDKQGALKTVLADLAPYELAWVVDAPVPESELAWAQKNLHLSQSDWGQAYFSIRYRTDVATTGSDIYDQYTLAEIKDRGGICADQAWYASISAKANGIPAMVVDPDGDRGAHAWLQWEASREGWSEAGRYTDNYAAGTTIDPQTHLTLQAQELRELTAPQRRTEDWTTAERYLQLSTLLAARPELARIALDNAVQLAPGNVDAWNRLLDTLIAAKASQEDWEAEIARMRVAFQKYPDVIQQINQRETQYLAANTDPNTALAAVERQKQRFLRDAGARTDLIIDSVLQEADLATEAGDPEKAGKIYRDALRDQGQEVVSFQTVAQKYYDWARSQGQSQRALEDINQAFARNFKPEGDFFALTAYHDSLAILLGMYKKEGLQSDVDRLDRLSEKVDAKLKALTDQAKRASNPSN